MPAFVEVTVERVSIGADGRLPGRRIDSVSSYGRRLGRPENQSPRTVKVSGEGPEQQNRADILDSAVGVFQPGMKEGLRFKCRS